jgi:hypothetical protein
MTDHNSTDNGERQAFVRRLERLEERVAINGTRAYGVRIEEVQADLDALRLALLDVAATAASRLA